MANEMFFCAPLVARYQSVIKSDKQPFAVAVVNVIADTLGVTGGGPAGFGGPSLMCGHVASVEPRDDQTSTKGWPWAQRLCGFVMTFG